MSTSNPGYLSAILKCKCPQCREGSLFEHSFKYFSKGDKSKEFCDVCGVKFEPEPGFYWGAMYISYAFSVAICVTVGFATFYLLNDPDIWIYMTLIVSALALFSPIALRYSRVLMLYWFGGIHYKKRIESK